MLATEATLAMATPFPTPLPATPASPPPPPSALPALPEPPSLPLLEVTLLLDVTSPTLPESSMSPRGRLRLTPMFSATPATQATDTPALAMLATVATTAATGLTLALEDTALTLPGLFTARKLGAEAKLLNLF